ncbi:dual specificity phosphatase 12, partial [Tremellales sp. Uapishka_1]
MASRPLLPQRSLSSLSSGPPSDSMKPDDEAVLDVIEGVSETGSLKLTARKLRSLSMMSKASGESAPRSEKDRYEPEEEEYERSEEVEEDEGEVDMVKDGEIEHLQEIVPGLWVGDLVAAMDTEGLEQRGITNIVSLLRPALKFPPQFANYTLEIDDGPATDILSHLPACVSFIDSVLSPKPGNADPTHSAKPGGVLVHCQAGMSRSATVTAAYLMTKYDLDPMQAVDMIKEKRPVVEPSDTFWHQLGLLYNADGRVSLKDRSTRQFYMERTASQFMNGDGSAPPLDKMAKYPATPTQSTPSTPAGGQGKRKIRCKMCRRQLAVREHMMDHILDQSPASRPRTPSNFALPSPIVGLSPSEASDIINPLTGMPVRSRPPSISSLTNSPSHVRETSRDSITKQDSGSVPLPRATTPGLVLTTSTPETGKISAEPLSVPPNPRSTNGNASLATLRESSAGMPALSSAFTTSPPSSPEEVTALPAYHPLANLHNHRKSSSSRRLSLLALTPTVSSDSRPPSGPSSPIVSAPPMILVNPKCSGYFVEPLTWMNSVLKNGDVAGKLVCPNEKCGVKIGSFDWAGVQCGCKEWVTPGFCLAKSKVEEVW